MRKVYSAIARLIEENSPGVVGTVISGTQDNCPTGTKFVADAACADVLGILPSGVWEFLQVDLKRVRDQRCPALSEVSWGETTLKIFLDPILPQSQLVICGGGHIAQPLVSMGKLLNYKTTVIDDRVSFANRERFPLADNVTCGDFREVLRGVEFTANTYVVIVTRGHRHDKTCLAEVLRKEKYAYVGMIGSRRKVYSIFESLQADGFSEELITEVHAPVGLDIGAETPEEIAISIMAEIIQVSHGKNTMKPGQRRD